MRVQSMRSILLMLSDDAPIFMRRDSIRAIYFHFNKATSMLQLSLTPRTFSPLDQTTNDLPFAQYARRSSRREIRTACGKRAVTTSIDHPSSTDQTTGLSEDGPVSPGASGQDGSDLETDAL